MRITLFFIGALLSHSLAAQKNPCNPSGLPYASLPGDTTITLPSGTMLTFNRCEYFDLRDCMEITEITDTAGLRRAGISMFDRNGNVLLTCGMINIDMKGCGKTCFDVPVKIKMRVLFQECSGDTNAIPDLFFGAGGNWEQPAGIKPKITTENNIRYMEFPMACSGLINCDKPKRGRKVKFIAPKGSKIEQLRIGRNCPLYFLDDKFAKPKRKQKVKILCLGAAKTQVQHVLVNQNNDQVRSDFKTLTTLRHGGKRVPCKEPKRSFFGRLFSWGKRSYGDLYKRYYL